MKKSSIGWSRFLICMSLATMSVSTFHATTFLGISTYPNILPVPSAGNSYTSEENIRRDDTSLQAKDISISQKQIQITEAQLTFQLEITADTKIRFKLPEWVKATNAKYKKGSGIYRFEATKMAESGVRQGNITITNRKGKTLAVVPIKQSLELNLQSRLAPVPQQAVFKEEGYFVWGASCIKGEDNLYHLFYSRWKKELGFASWASHSEIAHAVSKDLFGPYQFKNVVLPARGKQYWDGTTTHNPTIHKFGNKYYLYYMGNCGDGKVTSGLNWSHRNTQRIGVAVTSDLNGKWTRSDHPLIDISPEKDAPDHLIVNNPSIAQLPNGKYVLVYKAVGQKRPLPFGGPVVHLAATSDSPTGPFIKHEQQIFTSDGEFFPAEDPYIWSAGNRLYAIVKDFHGTFTHIGCSLALFESEDGLHWKPAHHKVVSGLEILWENGQKEKVKRLERPQLYIEDGIIKALFAAVTPIQGNTTYNVHIPVLPPSESKEQTYINAK